MRVVVVPSAPFLLPSYAARMDAAPALRAACVEAVSGLRGNVDLVTPGVSAAGRARGVREPLGVRVAAALLGDRVATVNPPRLERDVLVVADGSARRSTTAPGYLDDRAAGFDETWVKALEAGDPAALAGLDLDLADALLAEGAHAFARLGALLSGYEVTDARVDHADDPFGVMYAVAVWECSGP